MKNEMILLAKLKKRIELLEEYSFAESGNDIVFTGTMCDDTDDNTSKQDIQISQGSVWGEARCNYKVKGYFSATPKKGLLPIISLQLGTSKSLEILAFLYGPEAVVYIDGKEYSGYDPNHSEIILYDDCLDGKQHEILLDGWTGIKDEKYIVDSAKVAYLHQNTRRLADIAKMCIEVSESISDITISRAIYSALDKSFNCLDLYEPLGERFYTSVDKALETAENELNSIATSSIKEVIACGHGHLDLAWLWRTKTSVGKGARTFLNVLRLMDRKDNFNFSQTQAQLYKWIEDDYPDIFKQIKQKVQNGQWEVLGGMWVEPDCNIIGAESLVRQMLLYSKYTQEKLGVEGSPVVWLPDTFGFCGQLPQLMQSAGLKYFCTAKLTWNQYNKMPSEYFQWEGIDGSKVLSYIVTTSKPKWWGATYSADLTPVELIETIGSQNAGAMCDTLMIPYGMGDGGGGPTEKMTRYSDIMEQGIVPGLPRVKKGKFIDFFEKLETVTNLPKWVGELYFELHRGTYTSQAETKKNNIKCETMLHQAEFLASWASEISDYDYPFDDFNKAWQKVCLNQFHDILPGSSIHQVYEDTKKMHLEVMDTCEAIQKSAILHLEKLMDNTAQMVVFNTTSFGMSDYIEVPEEFANDDIYVNGVMAQKHGNFAYIEDVPAYGFVTLNMQKSASNTGFKDDILIAREATGSEAGKYVLENNLMTIELDKNADIISWNDKKSDREICSSNAKFNQFRLYEDRPADWDAWDIDEYYMDKGYMQAELISIKQFTHGSLCAGFKIVKSIGNSVIKQKIYINPDSMELNFDNEIDFKEKNQLLRVEFPVEIRNEYAEFGSQFGSVRRNTHYNTSWDMAKFETCMHKWADYSEGDYGVAIICSEKYGVSIHEGTISLALLRSPIFPDESADIGKHNFKYSILPHTKDNKNDVIKHAYKMSNPLIAYKVDNAKGTSNTASMVHIENENLIIETIKRSENNDSTIVRLYESGNTRGKATLNYHKKVEEAVECNILEEDKNVIKTEENNVRIEYQPYKIISLKIK